MRRIRKFALGEKRINITLWCTKTIFFSPKLNLLIRCLTLSSIDKINRKSSNIVTRESQNQRTWLLVYFCSLMFFSSSSLLPFSFKHFLISRNENNLLLLCYNEYISTSKNIFFLFS